MQEKGIQKKNIHKRKVHKQKVLTTRDIVFKKVFASPENTHILKGFINDILGLDVVEVTVENAYNIKTFYNEQGETGLQYTQVDVLARLREGSLVSVEMQTESNLVKMSDAKFELSAKSFRALGESKSKM